MSDAAPPRTLQQVPTTWDAVAPSYAEVLGQWAAYADEALRLVPLAPTDRVLDVACGPGTLAFAAAARAARVDAVDFSPGMIAEVRARAAREGQGRVVGEVMDAEALAFPDGTFDAAFCMFGFFFFPDRARAFRELHRVLRPGGRALIATWSPIERRPLMRLAFDAIAEALPEAPRPGKGDLQEPAECVREMSEAGFVDVTSRPFTASVFAESAEHLLDLIVKSAAPLAAMRKKTGEGAWAAMRQRLLEAFQRRVPPGGIELAAEAILTTGVR